MMCIAVKLSSVSKSLPTTIANRNYRAKRSGLILLKKIRKFAQNKQTNKQTDKQTNKQTDREFKYRGHSYPLWIVGVSGPIDNLIKFDVFEEVDDCGQERISSRWVVTQKEKADGQKSQVKGRIFAKAYQEGKTPQSDSPTLLRESLKMYLALAANEGFK